MGLCKPLSYLTFWLRFDSWRYCILLYFCAHVCHPKTLENDDHHLVVCLPRDQRLIHAIDAVDGRTKSMGEDFGFDLDIDTLNGCRTPSLAPAFLELDREVGFIRTREMTA